MSAGPHYVLIGGTSEPGGLHLHTATLARALERGGCRVTILCTSRDFFSELVADSGIRVVVHEAKGGGQGVRGFLEWSRAFRELAPGTAILCRGQAGQSPLALLLALRRHFARVVTIEHRVPDDELSWRQRLRFRLGRSWVDHSLAVSGAVRQAMIDVHGYGGDRVEICRLGVDPRAFRPDEEDRRVFRAEHAIPDEAFVVGYVGRFAPEKRLPVLIRGFASLRETLGRPARLVLAGGGWKEAELRELVRELALEEAVTFVGWEPDPSRWYRAFDCFVLPSQLEGLPTVVLEAMASGTLCLVHPFDAVRECVDHGRTGFVAELQSTEDMARELRRIHDLDESERRSMGAAARKRALRDFDPALRMLDLLRGVGALRAAEFFETCEHASEGPRTWSPKIP